MPVIVSRKRRIFFTMEGERGPTLLLLHGLLGHHRDWFDWGFVSALSPDFRLIIPDLLGHGRSDRPLEAEEYSLQALGADMLQLLNDLDFRNTTVVGYSLGALVGFGMALNHPERVRGIFVGGEAPYPSEPFMENCRSAATQLGGNSLAEVVEKARQEGWGQTARQAFEEEEEREAAQAMLGAIGAWEPDQTKKFMVRGPVTFFSGTTDPAYDRLQKARNITPRAKLFSLEGKNTLQALREPGALISEISGFVHAVRTTQETGSREQEARPREAGTEQQNNPPPPEASDAPQVEPPAETSPEVVAESPEIREEGDAPPEPVISPETENNPSSRRRRKGRRSGGQRAARGPRAGKQEETPPAGTETPLPAEVNGNSGGGEQGKMERSSPPDAGARISPDPRKETDQD